jgi:hypothetical protein
MLDFESALAASHEIHDKRHLLLGNGFSIACRADRFTYGRLLDAADLSALSVDGPSLFSAEETTDFEEIINSLRVAARMVEFYDTSDSEIAARLEADAELVKDALANALAQSHPDNVGEIEIEEYQSARRFLTNFGHIFTVNYDLLLYWTLMQEMEPKIRADDGFRADHDEPDAEWVRWDSYHGGSRQQNVYYLHGGLHLFEEGPVLKKLTFSRTGIALVDQIREALAAESYPLVITEGSSLEKLASIRHNDYLAKGLRSLAACKGSLFIHGHSLAENDAHVFKAIGGEGKFSALFVGLHGNPESDTNLVIQQRANAIAAERIEKYPLAVKFYDSGSAAVWG